jgi:hypothetical protein
MKLGILLLATGVLLLIAAIPYSIVSIVAGVAQLEAGIVAGGFSPYIGIIGVIAGFVLTTIGSVKVFRH